MRQSRAFVVGCAIVLGGVISVSCSGGGGSTEVVVQVKQADRVCKDNSECTTVMTHCSCHCGEAVNKQAAPSYEQQTEAACRDYSGPMCKLSCPAHAQCVGGQCSPVTD